jgi:F-type H+-transporting ATPase subunit gamma
MSGTTESLRRRISGAGDLESVVRSMKALAASSIGQYENAVQALDGYYRTVELGLSVCLRQLTPGPPDSNRRLKGGPTIGAIIFGSDEGLVGQFNDVLAEFTIGTLKALPSGTRKLWVVGDRIRLFFGDTENADVRVLSVPNSVHSITPLVSQIITEIGSARERTEMAEVYLFHNKPTTGAAYIPVKIKLLPLDDSWRKKVTALRWPTRSMPEVIGDTASALQAFIRGYLFVLLFQASAESLASENASRLGAMQRAEKNIGDALEELNRSFHRLRQDAIDEELFDVISGYEMLLREAQKRRY